MVLVTVDTLRADRTSAYGYARPTTPTLAAVARDGTLFEDAYANMPTTGPSHASLFTARHPLDHGVVRNGFVLGDEHRVMAEVLKGHGFRTAAFVSSFVVSRSFGFAQGFDVYDEDFSVAEGSYGKVRRWEGVELPGGFDRRADETTDRALAWLATGAAEAGPFFLWVHYFDPHEPYDPPEAWRRQYVGEEGTRRDIEWARSLYDAEVAFTDHQIGRLLDGIEKASPGPRTLLLVTSDHGEGLMDHGFMGHGAILYEETMRVPLLVRWPGRVAAGQRLRGPVQLTDLLPTLLSLLGVADEEGPRGGRDLSAALAGGAPLPEDRPVFMQRRLYERPVASGFKVEGIRFGRPLRVVGPKFAVRRGDWKYIEAPDEGTRELFHLGRDARESINLATQHPELGSELAEAIRAWRIEQTALSSAPLEADEEQLRRLRAIGYMR